MTPKQKAESIYNKMIVDFLIDKWQSKQCALMAVDEIILSNPHSNPLNTDTKSTMEYWMEVKEQINNL